MRINIDDIFNKKYIKAAAEKPAGITEPPQETTEQEDSPEQAETPESSEKDLLETAKKINEQIDEKVEELQESGEHLQEASQNGSALLPPEQDEIQKAVQEANAEGQQTADTTQAEIQDEIQETKIERAKNGVKEKEETAEKLKKIIEQNFYVTDAVNVKRSSGEIEDDWKYAGYGSLKEGGDSFDGVRVIKKDTDGKTIEKCIPLEEFCNLNNLAAPTEEKNKQTEDEAKKIEGETEKPKTELAEKIKETEISPEYLAQDFQEKFNIKQEDLEKIEGWQDLSPGQQALVLENLKQITVGRIEEEGLSEYKQKTSEAKFLGRVWRNVFKKYYVVKAEKATAEDLQKGGITDHGEFLSQLVSGLKENGPGVKITEQGALEIQFASGFKNLNEQQVKQVENFNKIATVFSKMPYEWGLATASKKQREKFDKIKDDYEKAKESLLDVETKQSQDASQAMLAVAKIEKNVQLNQFLNTHPEIEERLKNIKDKSAFKQLFTNVATERGAYMAGGFVTRTTAIGLLGWVGAPLAAAGMAGLIAKKRSKETLKEQEKLGRKGISESENLKTKLKTQLEPFLTKLKKAREEGVREEIEKALNDLNEAKKKPEIEKLEKALLKTEGKEKNFVDATGLTEKLKNLVSRIDEATSETEKKKLRGLLDTRLGYTQEKINEGLVDFGTAKERLSNQYELLKKISEGEAIALLGEKEIIKSKSGKTLNERLDKFLTFKGEKISQAQKKYVRNQIIKGASFGFAFASLGMLAREAIGAVSGGDGGGSNIPELPTRKGILAGTAENIKAKQSPGIETATVQPRVGAGSAETVGAIKPSGGASIPEAAPVSRTRELTASSSGAASRLTEAKIGYQGGKSIWQEAEKQLTARFQEKFAKLGGADTNAAEALKTINIDRLKDTIVQNPQEYGLAKGIVFERMSDEQIKNINWDKAVDNTFGVFEKRPDLTVDLTKGQVENIIENNEQLRNYFQTHPGASRSQENIDAVLKGKELAETEKVISETTVPQTPSEKIPEAQKVFEKAEPKTTLAWEKVKEPATEAEEPAVEEWGPPKSSEKISEESFPTSQKSNIPETQEITSSKKERISGVKEPSGATIEKLRREFESLPEQEPSQNIPQPPEDLTRTAPESAEITQETMPETITEPMITDETKFFETISREVQYDLQNYKIELPQEIKQGQEITDILKSVKEQIEGLRADIKAGALEPARLTPEKVRSDLSLIEQLQNKISLQEAAKQLKLVNEKLTENFNVPSEKIDKWLELQKIAQNNPEGWEQHEELLQYKILLLEKKTIQDYLKDDLLNLAKFKKFFEYQLPQPAPPDEGLVSHSH